MRYLEIALDRIEFAHRWLSEKCLRFWNFVWAWQAKRSLNVKFAVGFAVMSLILIYLAWQTGGSYLAAEGGERFDPSLIRYLDLAGHLAAGKRIAMACLLAGALAAGATLASLVRKPTSFRVFQISWAAAVPSMTYAIFWLLNVGSIFVANDHKAFDAKARNELWTAIFFWSLPLIIFMLGLLLALTQKTVRAAYLIVSEPITKDAGPKALDGLKTTTGDRRWKSSLYYAFVIFFFVFFGPYLIIMWGWEEPYLVPKGDLASQPEVVKIKKKKKKPKKLTVNPWSPYILERMDIDDVATVRELEEESRDTYKATNAKKSGGKGKGVPGWPDGAEGGVIRFIRLKYAGGDWDQDMGKGADYNLLLKFHEWTGMKIHPETEFREITRLKYFPKHKSPPFVFMTGSRGINVTEGEVKTLRNYCEKEGGLLFIDNGGGHFDHSVRALLRRVFPGKSLVDIPNDDEIYQNPYTFPDGAPPFWHHAGYRALGIRDEGRWMVFYHPGDINDAWRDDHSGASPEVADQAYKLGVNVIFYSFNKYFKRHFGQ